MKKLLLILLCLPIISLSQKWIYNSGSNDFDGSFRTASIVGKGTDYPYGSPSLVINYFDNKNQINFYITDAGYYPSSSNTKVLFSFSNEKGTIYESNSVSYSSDNKSVFLGNSFSPKNTKRIDIFKKLMSASYVNIRVTNDYGKNDLNFSLNGSSTAIKRVVPYDFFKEHNNTIQKSTEKEKIKDKEISIRDSVLMISLNNYNITEKIKIQTLNEVNNKINYKGYQIENIDSLLLWKSNPGNSYYINVKIYYKSYYAQEFMKILKISKKVYDKLPSKNTVFNSKDNNFDDIVETKPKRKDYKSSNDYFKALREYNKKKKQ